MLLRSIRTNPGATSALCRWGWNYKPFSRCLNSGIVRKTHALMQSHAARWCACLFADGQRQCWTACYISACGQCTLAFSCRISSTSQILGNGVAKKRNSFKFRSQDCDLKFQLQVAVSSCSFKFQLQVSVSRFSFKFQLQVPFSSFRFMLRFQVSVSSSNYNFEFQESVSHSSFQVHFQDSVSNIRF